MNSKRSVSNAACDACMLRQPLLALKSATADEHAGANGSSGCIALSGVAGALRSTTPRTESSGGVDATPLVALHGRPRKIPSQGRPRDSRVSTDLPRFIGCSDAFCRSVDVDRDVHVAIGNQDWCRHPIDRRSEAAVPRCNSHSEPPPMLQGVCGDLNEIVP